MKTQDEVKEIVNNVKFMDRKFVLSDKGIGWLLQVEYNEPDILTDEVEVQRSRKWYISPHMTETEIVETAFACCLRSMQHVVKEHFTYKDHRVYSPHFSINARVAMCAGQMFDKRPGEM